MNRSILIVICDFLLISLLAFSNVDEAKLAEQGGAPNLKLELSATPPKEQPSRGQDLGNVMKLALNEERKGREQLLSELNKTRDAAMKQEAALTERDKQVQTYQQELQTRQQTEARLQQRTDRSPAGDRQRADEPSKPESKVAKRFHGKQADQGIARRHRRRSAQAGGSLRRTSAAA